MLASPVPKSWLVMSADAGGPGRKSVGVQLGAVVSAGAAVQLYCAVENINENARTLPSSNATVSLTFKFQVPFGYLRFGPQCQFNFAGRNWTEYVRSHHIWL